MAVPVYLTWGSEWITFAGARLAWGVERMTTYGPRIKVHPDRFGVVKTRGANRLLVLHTSEGGETTGSAEALGVFMEQPGDRVDPEDGSRFGASYQYVIDTDRVLPAVPDNVVAYAAAGANNDGIHYCFPGKANQTRAQWLDTNSSAMLVQCASALRDKSAETGIPLRRLTVAQVVEGESGYCDHNAIRLAYGRTDHTDVGPNFPWDVFAGLLADPLPPEADTVEPLNFRLLDTRTLGGKAQPGQVIPLDLSGKVPDAAHTVFINLTLVEPEAACFLTAWGAGPNPGTSNVNADAAGQIRANLALVGLDAELAFRVQMSRAASHLVVDVQGYSQ